MGKKDKVSVGRSIIKDRGKGNKQGKGKESWLHTSDINDGEDNNKLPMQSITEQSALDEFLATAELAGTEFVAEKLNVTVVPSYNKGGLPSLKEEQRIKQVQDDHKQFLQIPRRPSWNEKTTAEQLEQSEKESFLNWRRRLAELQEKDDIILTPFERNLQFWRQLWRVIERSDVIVQIVDARNPLLFRCEDLESYVKEISSHKASVLLVNKADLLTQEQRETWAKYFQTINVRAVFWSAVIEAEKHLKDMEETNTKGTEVQTSSSELPENVLSEKHVTKFLDLDEDTSIEDPEKSSVLENDEDKMDIDVKTVSDEPEDSLKQESDFKPSLMEEKSSSTEQEFVSTSKNGGMSVDEQVRDLPSSVETSCSQDKCELMESCVSVVVPKGDDGLHDVEVTRVCGKAIEFYTSGHLLSGEELLDYCQWLHQEYDEVKDSREDKPINTVIGLVGYPNVGKSSTINAILHAKKVPVSATPGRTKHFQTLFVDKNICLCDCPGLVFPSFVSTKAEMVVNGILPIDQMRDHIAPVSLVCRRIPRNVFETVYGINLVGPQEGEDPNREPYAEELLNAYGYSKGYMTSQGRPDCPRSSRYILKDYVNGKLLYCHAPPLHDPASFQFSFTGDIKHVKKRHITNQKTTNKTTSLDNDFFKETVPKSFVSATTGTEQYRRHMAAAQTAEPGSSIVLPNKPWKKHGNRNKKEKLRRLQDKSY